ncbi:MAG: type IV toxin-antitoxin system AbiEi family antitoxin domain-containing protein [Clostridia bacterium]|nr:type IV toxin-antitoxin system AbiEi family antitoxin domain-containing protein [Clostridia bacterium]
MTYKEKILEIGSNNSGYVLRKDIVESGIPSIYLYRMLQREELIKVASGIYTLPDTFDDDYLTFSLKHSDAVFCRRAALSLHNMTNVRYIRLEANFPRDYNTRYISTAICHRCSGPKYETGIEQTTTHFGNTVKCYDRERCMCDLFLYDFTYQEEKQFAVRAYFGNSPDIDKLYKYAKLLGVEREIKTAVEVLL